MKEIILSNGLKTIVDDKDYEKFHKYSYNCNYNGYASRSIKINGQWSNLLLHREIMNPPDGMFIDHINRNRLDNRKENLRVCNIAQNRYNSGPNKDTSSKYKGVHYCKKRKLYNSIITFEGKTYNLGSYYTEEEAAIAFNLKAKELQGEFAYLNDVEEILKAEKANNKIKTGSSSKYIGVHFNNKEQLYRASLRLNGKVVLIHRSKNEKECAIAFDDFVEVNELNKKTNKEIFYEDLYLNNDQLV